MDGHIESFLRRLRGKKAESTVANRKSHLKSFNQWCDKEDKDVTQCTKFEIEDHLFMMIEEDYAGGTVKSRYDSIKVFYDYIEDRGIIGEHDIGSIDINDWNHVDKGTKKSVQLNEDIYYLEPHEKELLCDNVPSPKFRNELIIRLLYQTGVRQGELSNIRKDDIDREQRSIKIRGEKSNENRRVYYQPNVDALLETWLHGGYRSAFGPAAESDYLFVTIKSEKVDGKWVNEIVKQAAEDAGIQENMYVDHAGKNRKKITAHSLRHSYAVQTLKNGASIKYIKEVLGHAEIETTEEKYLHITDQDLKDAMDHYGAGSEAVED